MSEKKLFLLDGHALVYRAHFAFITRPLINSKGINTSAITGFVRTLWDLMKREKPTHIAVAFDPKGKVFRHEEFPEYKANRDAQPEDISIALPYIKKIVEGFNIPIIMVDNYEADDIIGTVAKQAEQEGFTVYMVTPDKDYAQLVSDKVFMYKPSRQGNGIDILGEKEVLEKWDISNVNQVIDILGLQGDSVDNIPGIPGIGAKTAVKLLKLYGSVENLIANTDKLKGKQKENVENFAEQGLLSKRLATINIESPITFDAIQYRIDPLNKEVLSEIFKDLEFRTLANQILGGSGANQGTLFGNNDNNGSKTQIKPAKDYSVASKNIDNTSHEYQLVDTDEAINALVELLSKHQIISFDTETTGIDANQAELVGLAWSVEAGKAFYVPIPEDKEEAQRRIDHFKHILENQKVLLIGQNIKYDKLMMKWYDVELLGPFFDTMITHYLCEPDLRHKLDYLSESYLNYKMVPITDLIGKAGKNQLTMRSVPIDKASEYAGEDADITFQMMDLLKLEMEEQEVGDVYYLIEEPLISVLTDMEYEGVNVDGEFLNKYSVQLGEWIRTKEKEIYTQAGVDFNIASPKQVGQVLFDKLEIPYRWKKTSSGAYSTDVEKLSELAVDHDIVKNILEYRKLAKLKSTYVDSLPLMINKKTGRVHSNFNQARAATGRLSSLNPNLQNIPIKNEEGREIRKAFIPRDSDHTLLAADYSQIELRIVADVSKDPVMLDAFVNGKDFHTATAAQVYDVEYDDVTAEQRRNAKTVNFSILYGAGATNLSRQLGIKRAEAKTLIETYFTQFPSLKAYMDETVQFARDNGYVQTLVGRKRKLRDINSRNGLTRSNAERVAVNTPIQGSAADMIKMAMITIHKKLKEGNYRTKMILQVHDELVFDVYNPEMAKIKKMVEECMRTAMPQLKVPIVVGMDTGANWLEAH